MAGHEIRIIQFLSPTEKNITLMSGTEQRQTKKRITSNFAALPAIQNYLKFCSLTCNTSKKQYVTITVSPEYYAE